MRLGSSGGKPAGNFRNRRLPATTKRIQSVKANAFAGAATRGCDGGQV